MGLISRKNILIGWRRIGKTKLIAVYIVQIRLILLNGLTRKIRVMVLKSVSRGIGVRVALKEKYLRTA